MVNNSGYAIAPSPRAPRGCQTNAGQIPEARRTRAEKAR